MKWNVRVTWVNESLSLHIVKDKYKRKGSNMSKSSLPHILISLISTEFAFLALLEDREETQDPEVEFAIAGAMTECGGLNLIQIMVQNLRDDELKSNQEELGFSAQASLILLQDSRS
jgi:hypothetical protein